MSVSRHGKLHKTAGSGWRIQDYLVEAAKDITQIHVWTISMDWPPQSPSAALLSSPGGRKKVRRIYEEQRSEEDLEDEETLELELQALQAKIRLRRLRQKTGGSRAEPDTGRESERRPKAGVKVAGVQIPVSPNRRVEKEIGRSPRRIQLGIDKGRTGRQVSLRRPESDKVASDRGSSSQGKSFSQRIAEIRQDDKSARDRLSRSLVRRSQGFGIAKETIEASHATAKKQAEALPSTSSHREISFSRDEVLQNIKQPKSKRTEGKKDVSNHLFDPFSTTHLSKRLLSHDLLTSSFKGKSVLQIPDLLAKVKSPQYELPAEMDADFVVLATIASKSQPMAHQNSGPVANDSSTSFAEAERSIKNDRGKYMIITLTDLKWTLDLFLFGSAFSRFYKLAAGTVVAILNPSIMPPPPRLADTGRFSLTLNSNEDTILEIGVARDLAWCKSICKSGKSCSQWVDKRRTEFCDFHVNAVLEKRRQNRMETQGSSAPYTSAKGNNRASQPNIFIAPPPGGNYASSAASLLDQDTHLTMTTRGETRSERVRRKLAEREQENAIAKQLGTKGNGAGSEYLRQRQGPDPDSRPQQKSSSRSSDAAGLGLTSNTSANVHLSPLKSVKRKASCFRQGDSSPLKKTRFVTVNGIKETGTDSDCNLREAAQQAIRPDDDSDLEFE